MHSCHFLKLFLQIFENSPASGRAPPSDPHEADPSKVFLSNQVRGGAAVILSGIPILLEISPIKEKILKVSLKFGTKLQF